MMTCRDLAQLLVDFVADELAEEHRELVQRHLSRCPPCVVYLETYKLTIQITRQLPPGPLPEGLGERLIASWREIQAREGSSEDPPPESPGRCAGL